MPQTLEGLAIGLAFLIPGIAYELGIERVVGYWRTSLADRVLRFFAVSALLQALAAPATYIFWRRFIRDAGHSHESLFAVAGRRYTNLPMLGWIALIAYLAVPFLLGIGTGYLARRRPTNPASLLLVGRDPAPRGWDYLFGRADMAGIVRARMRDGSWVAGMYAVNDAGNRRGYASSFPITEDVYLPMRLQIDTATGELQLVDDAPIRLPWSLLIKRDDVDVLEFLEVAPDPITSSDTVEGEGKEISE
jgi:hypothetical protein